MDATEATTWQEWIQQFPHTCIPIDEKRSHYHFKKRKDMKRAMIGNYSLYDTFSYAGKGWQGKIPTKEQLTKEQLIGCP